MKFNTQVKKIQDDLINLINNSNLPITVIRLIFDSAVMQIKELEKNIIEQEAA